MNNMASVIGHTLLPNRIKHRSISPFWITQTELKPGFETHLPLAAMQVILREMGQGW